MISLRNITKSYGQNKVLNEVSFSLAPGRITGFVGGNGAGKTTSMRILMGVLSSDGGEVLYDDSPITAGQRRRIGYMPEERGLYPKMRVLDQLSYLAQLHGLSKTDAVHEAQELLEKFQLAERAKDKIEELSLGNQQRVQIAAALVQKPQFLVLDEPFSGLDMLAVDNTLNILREYTDRGVGILFSSHQLEIVDQLCDDIVIIAGGVIRAAGEKEAVREAHSELKYRLKTGTELPWLTTLDGIEIVCRDGAATEFTETVAGAAQEVLRRALAETAVLEFTPVRPSIAEIFRGVVK